jgi:TolB protein
MGRKLILSIGFGVLALLLWFTFAAGVRAADFTIFLPLLRDEALRGDIVFYQFPNDQADPDAEIMLVRLPERTTIQLTDNEYDEYAPDWSPDGQQIVYTSYQQGNGDIFVMDRDGSNPSQLTATAENDGAPAWSPDGKRILFTRYFTTTETSLLLVELPGLQETRLTTGTIDASPSWSPDGSQVAFASARDGDAELYILDLGSRVVRQVTQNTELDGEPVWSPDGTQLLALAMDSLGERALYRINVDGTGKETLTGLGFVPMGHDWSADGTKIVYVGATKFSRELYVWRLDKEAWEAVTTPDAPIFENSMRDGPRWYQSGPSD